MTLSTSSVSDLKLLKKSILYASLFSKDPSTKVGCLIVEPDDPSILISQGYNGMPRGFLDSDVVKNTRPLKYSYYEHAERNALYNKARTYLEGSVVITTEFPSIGCLRAISQVGAIAVFCPAPSEGDMELDVKLDIINTSEISLFQINADYTVSTVRQENQHSFLRIDKFLNNYMYLLNSLHIEAEDEKETQGCLFLNPTNYAIVTQGYSGVPRLVSKGLPSKWLSDKNIWEEKCVRYAIYNKIRKDLKDSIVSVTDTSCMECARALVCCEVSKVIQGKPTEDMLKRWAVSFEATLKLFKEAGIESIELDKPIVAIQK